MRAENELRKVRLYQERKLWEEELPKLCEQWRNGADVNITRPRYNWYERDEEQPKVPTMLRIVGDEVETSMGARVPVDHAARALKFVRACMNAGREYNRNGHTEHIGHYAIDRIEADGTLHAGCHVIAWEEIQKIAPMLERIQVSTVHSPDLAKLD
jgi:hypothetical protein